MGVWTADIKVHRAWWRATAALVAGGVLAYLTATFFPAVLFAWFGFPPRVPFPGFVLLAGLLFVNGFLPLYAAVWLYWQMMPGRAGSGWLGRTARLVVVAKGIIVEAVLFSLLMAMADELRYPGSASMGCFLV